MAPPLLSLNARDRAGLSWLQCRARGWLTDLKRQRKYRVREPVFEPEETRLLQALVNLEQAARQVLVSSSPREGVRPHGPPVRLLATR